MDQGSNRSKRPLSEYTAEVCERGNVRGGVPLPFGAFETQHGVNFSFFSRNASHVRLEFFVHPEDTVPIRFIDFDPIR